MKDIVQISENKSFSHIEFGVFSPEDIVQRSHLQVFNKELYDENKNPAENGVLDLRLGVSRTSQICTTCGENGDHCLGHYGYIHMSQPIFPYTFLKDIVKICKCICKFCGHILLPKEERMYYYKRMNKPNINYISKKKLRKEIILKAKKTKTCLQCLSPNGDVKKVKSLSIIVHKKYTLSKQKKSFEDYIGQFSENIRELLSDGYEILRPYEVYYLFEKIPVKHFIYLGINPNTKRSISDFIFKYLTVTPTAIRPSVQSFEGSREDSLTLNLKMIIDQKSENDLHNDFTKMIKPAAATMPNKDDKYQRGIHQRLCGKKGRFRCNLSGKRTNFTGRTVISPDPTLPIDVISIPEYVALKLTFTECVTPYNIEVLRKHVLNGPFKHPGAERVLKADGKNEDELQELTKFKLLSNPSDWVRLRAEKIREKMAFELKVGDFVERHLKNGDQLLFNRQPSLHRLSFQSFRCKIKKERTFSFNPCCCNPFNADFDGDEMNIHFPQTYDAKAECATLISSTSNVTSPNSGEPLTSPLQDILTASFLLTSKDTFLSVYEFSNYIYRIRNKFPNTNFEFNIPKPAILKPYIMFTGKQLFNTIISPFLNANKTQPKIRLNMMETNKLYKQNVEDKYLAHNDSVVIIQNSELLSGQLDKSMLGGGSKKSLFYRLIHDASMEDSCRAMERVCNVSLLHLKFHGFSLGLSDVTPSAEMLELKKQCLQSNFDLCSDFQRQFQDKVLICAPGSTLSETLETKVSKTLSEIRDKGGDICMKLMPKSNAGLIMSICGSKGSPINLSQMVFCVGQQIVQGKRIKNVSRMSRTAHTSSSNCKNASSLGFVKDSFFSGVRSPDFMFHSMSGREGLVDTAVKTAESGYLQRRLVKNLEDGKIDFDGSVRDISGNIIQFQYGIDGFDPMKMDNNNQPCIMSHELNCISTDLDLSGKSLTRDQAQKCAAQVLAHYDLSRVIFSDFPNKIRNVIDEYYANLLNKDNRLNSLHIDKLVKTCYRKYLAAIIEPETAVGVICGESIGEPATQMTLKTFHFAGVASMNVTQGMPRMTEILNAVKKIETPIITVRLLEPYKQNSEIAKEVQAKIHPVYMEEIIETIFHVDNASTNEIHAILKTDLVRKYGLDKYKLSKTLNTKLKSAKFSTNVIELRDGKMYIEISLDDFDISYFDVYKMINQVQIVGIVGVKRTIINRSKDGEHLIFVEGGSITDLFYLRYVDENRTESNDLMNSADVFGIETARSKIISELNVVMGAHNLTPDYRHLLLIADFMTHTGTVQGFQRSGMEKSKNSVLCLASFEKTIDHLTEASFHGQRDRLNGVTDSIIFGKSLPIGTGSVHVSANKDMLVTSENKQKQRTELLRKRKALFDIDFE